MKGWALVVLALTLLLGALMVKDRLLVPPEIPSFPTSGQFDANRAAERLARILGDERPHPVDSDAGDGVRSRLLAEMRAVGLSPRIDDGIACNGGARSRAISCTRVRNLVATIGPDEGEQLLLVSHYDSTPAGPGAADDGIGVASMLEVAHLLRGQALSRPVSFLFNEGEERGLLGARAFLDRDPLAARVATLINLEARGTMGPAIMFETSRPNATAIALFRRGSDRPVANSLSTDLYRLIPNSTDVAVFAERPWTILNFAVIGDESRYHSVDDRLAALDRRSLQHMGAQALGIVGAAQSVDRAPEGERIYADFLSHFLVVLPLTFGIVLLALLFLFLVIETRRRGAIGLPLLAMFAAVGDSAILAWAAHALVAFVRGGDFWRAFPGVTLFAIYASALACAVTALVVLVRNAEPARLRPAFWLIFVILGGLIAILAPGVTIFLLLPPLVASIGMALGRRQPALERLAAICAALLLFLTFAPALGLMEELLNDGPLWIFAPLGALLLLPFLIELSGNLAALSRRSILAGAFLLAAGAWMAVLLVPAYTRDRPQLFTVEYVWNEAAHRGRFAVHNDGAPVPFDADWERVELPYTARMRWSAPAPAAPVAPPRATLLGERQVGDARHVRLRLAADGWESVILFAPAEAGLVAGGVGGKLRRFGEGPRDQRYSLRCVGRSCDGSEVDLVIARGEPVTFQLIGIRPGLPPAAGPLVAARPTTARAQYGPDSTVAIGRIRL